jgi:hypothetical protein
MNDAMRRCEERRTAGVRLLEVAYHNRWIVLYTRLGFKVRDLVARLQGPPHVGEVPGHTVREVRPGDLEGCNAVCRSVHGQDRSRELSDAISQNTALVVEHDGLVTGYSAVLAYYAHSVAQSNEDMKALILSGRQFGGAGILY